MGSSKKQTVGYRYRLGMHMGICHGPVDSVREIRAGDRVAWTGNVTESSQISINAPELFGGDEREGGIVGATDVMMGEPTQGLNSYLLSKLGNPLPAFRGILSLVFRRGLITSNNPYVKAWQVRVRRILKGWHGGEAWYPEKAEVPLVERPEYTYDQLWKYKIEAPFSPADYSAAAYDDSAWDVGEGAFGSWIPPGSGLGIGTPVEGLIRRSIWLRRRVTGAVGEIRLDAYHDDGCQIWWNGSLLPLTSINYFTSTVTIPGELVTGNDVVAMKVTDGVPSGSTNIFAGLSITNLSSNLAGMNPAHIAYQCLTDPEWGMGYPASIIDDASFRAAADVFHAEGMGLCLKWAQQDSIQSFIQVVMDHAGAALAQDPRTGLFRLKPIRGDYDIDDLPVFGSEQGNVLQLESFERATYTEAINELTVTYVDQATGKDGSVTVQQLANVQAQGSVVSQSRDYTGLATIDLAARVAMRDLRSASSGLARVRMTCNREAWDLLPGDVIAFAWPDYGIAKIAMRVLRVDYGSLTSGAIRVEAAEDVFGLPAGSYVKAQPIGWEEPDLTPQPSPAITAFEVPYRELVGQLGAANAAALAPDAGYAAVAAVAPAGYSTNYELRTATSSTELEQAADGDWCPSATLAVIALQADTVLELDDAEPFAALTLWTALMLGDGGDAEIVRLDAIDTFANTITVGRGCCDTTPGAWPVGTRLWAFDEFAAGDPTEYVEGEVITAAVLSRTGTGLLDLALAPQDTFTMDSRAARPYAPGLLRIADGFSPAAAYPADRVGALTVSWAHRDRLLQQDKLIDASEASIGPEPGTTYTVRFYLGGVLNSTETGITGTSSTPYTLTGDGTARVEVVAVRDGLESWQPAAAEFAYLRTPASPRITDAGDTRITDSGERRILE